MILDTKYVCVIESSSDKNGNTTYGGYCLDIPASIISRKSKDEVISGLRESIALSILSYEDDGLIPPAPFASPSEVVKESEGDEVILIAPAPVNPVSLSIEKAIEKAGISRSELARRLGVNRSQATRIVDPFYFGHTVSTLNRVAEALGKRLEIQLI
ncbi:hypothetical protein GCM10017784_37100 [Deinococcus indicus]|uniref:helix-turn-helix domain-containing protein n=1 Tax=Deinococcus indicus TaxID=223556 RepID=UPI00174CEE41|nr:helix-turn-helix transcriptional regulator [Deinococcus indicus]GHG38920.1 hypothetical protein GCM10017784_37100 [Deinococcus indicus]